MTNIDNPYRIMSPMQPNIIFQYVYVRIGRGYFASGER